MRFDHCFFIYYCLCCEDQHAARHAWLLWVFVSFLNVPGRGGGGGGEEEPQSLPAFVEVCALAATSISEDIRTMGVSPLLQAMCPGCLEGCQAVPDGGGWPDCGKLRVVLHGVWQQSWS